LAKEIRLGAPGTELLEELCLLWRECAKMHPSSTRATNEGPKAGAHRGLFAAIILSVRPADDLSGSHARN
jgi:hypothetical protein